MRGGAYEFLLVILARLAVFTKVSAGRRGESMYEAHRGVASQLSGVGNVQKSRDALLTLLSDSHKPATSPGRPHVVS